MATAGSPEAYRGEGSDVGITSWNDRFISLDHIH